MEYRAVTIVSLGLYVGFPDHLAPLLGFLGDELAEVGGRERKHRTAQIDQSRLYRRIGEAALISLLSFSMTSVGVPFDTPTPNQPLASYP
jgi:hypothetical protein